MDKNSSRASEGREDLEDLVEEDSRLTDRILTEETSWGTAGLIQAGDRKRGRA